jgi:DNA-binding NtrC family response regulator
MEFPDFAVNPEYPAPTETNSKFKAEKVQLQRNEMTETITVLLVDEDQDILDITTTFLQREDEALDVTPMSDTATALETIQADPERIDCVISDYSMPEMTGVEFLRAVREADPDVPFFFFTGRDRQQIEAELGEETVTGYVQKGTGTERYADLATEIRDAVES